MKHNLVITTVLTSAMMMVAGCQSGTHETAKPATSAPATTTAAPAKTTPPATMAKAIRINAGGAAVKDATGVEWLADTGFQGSDMIERPDQAIANTKQPEIYRSEHYSMESFSQPVPNGKYQVKLHFAETYEGITAAGERVFSFDVEGKPFPNFDVWVKAGGFAKAYVETVDVTVADGKLDIKFTPNVENPEINGIEIIPVP